MSAVMLLKVLCVGIGCVLGPRLQADITARSPEKMSSAKLAPGCAIICAQTLLRTEIFSAARFADVCSCSCGNVHVTSLACATYEYSTAHWISAVNFYFGILPLKIC